MPGEPTLVIGDEEEAKAATLAQMNATARRYGVGMGSPVLPSTLQDAANGFVRPATAPRIIPLPPTPQVEVIGHSLDRPVFAPTATNDTFLLLTTAREGAKAVKMIGSTSGPSWRMSAEAASAAAQVLAAFGVNVVDLRDEEPEEEAECQSQTRSKRTAAK